MRDYLSPARDYLGKAKVHVALLSKNMLKPRFVAILASMAAITIFAMSIITLKVMAQDSSQNNETITETKIAPGTTSVTQTVTTQSDTPPADSVSETTASTTKSNDAQTTTSVTVNNQPIEVPQNGSVQKVITNDNGTTQVNVSVNSSDSSTNVSTHSSSTYNVNTHTSSQNVIYRSP